jgi:hypothetical protein
MSPVPVLQPDASNRDFTVAPRARQENSELVASQFPQGEIRRKTKDYSPFGRACDWRGLSEN